MDKQESKKRKLTKKMKRKLAGVFAVTLLAFAGLLTGITVINAREGNRYAQQVLSQSQQQYTNTTIPFRRGTITDRNGTVLTNSVKVYNLILDCQAVNYNEDYREPTIAALEEYFNIDRETIEGLLDNEETSSSQYQILETEVSMDDKNAFEDANTLPDDEEERNALSEEERTRRSNIQGIYFEDAVHIFEDPFLIEDYDEVHSSEEEDRYNYIGMVREIVMLFVVATDRNGKMRIISARKATRKEVQEYNEQNAKKL